MIKKVVAAAAATGGLVLAGAGIAVADSGAQGAAVKSPGVLSGNVVQAPIHVPVNACGNTVSVIGLLNPAFGNTCVNK
ncbi:chaplin [Streptomyces agglomeratus]|uniref:Chaplin n=1 Tax=Streptomyces agglomeratus TaxID=285458 RepID=A0A1E5PDT3_9ACTN|nr:chaplin ChpH [Streptomyces agglomeratus]OEJ27687.1 chaplin [Streptomyces agglomeratus]OEJ38251.1 chaplin [Streptomyces agglomeratus]OEJ47364.1 chaplin [Streptomyces agglomeratus]OEJ50780.1 chaplin [Streptomyces agglomeratus]OEJ58142.1 chaplin [Streptomyces agglomeratus]